MENLGTVILETERLILRPLRVSDAKAMFENWATSEIVTRYVTWEPYTDIAPIIKRFEGLQKEYEAKEIYDWGIVLKEGDCLIGEISFIAMTKDKKIAQLGYIIGENWWGQGYVAEALKAIMEFSFKKLELHRIEAIYDVRNPGSGRVMEKLGMQYEGTFREYRFVKGEFVTVKQYAILDRDFLNKNNF